jgi:hypothetical protein
MKWNPFSDELATEKQKVRDYGIKVHYNGRVKFAIDDRVHIDSYKAQALRELAKREILEDMVHDLAQLKELVVNQFDGVSAEEMAAQSGRPVSECERLKSLL